MENNNEIKNMENHATGSAHKEDPVCTESMPSLPRKCLHTGRVIILSDKTRITDPCYAKNVTCTSVIPTLPGKYFIRKIYVSDIVDPNVDALLSVAFVCHQSVIEELIHSNFRTKFRVKCLQDMDIGVDSGECGLYCDYRYPLRGGLEIGKSIYNEKESRYPDGDWGITFNHFGGDISPHIFGHKNEDGLYDIIYLEFVPYVSSGKELEINNLIEITE